MNNLSNICECKQHRGENLYNTFQTWTNGEIKPFGELNEDLKRAWIMTSLNKKNNVASFEPNQTLIQDPPIETPKPKPKRQLKVKKTAEPLIS